MDATKTLLIRVNPNVPLKLNVGEMYIVCADLEFIDPKQMRITPLNLGFGMKIEWEGSDNHPPEMKVSPMFPTAGLRDDEIAKRFSTMAKALAGSGATEIEDLLEAFAGEFSGGICNQITLYHSQPMHYIADPEVRFVELVKLVLQKVLPSAAKQEVAEESVFPNVPEENLGLFRSSGFGGAQKARIQ